MGGAGGHAQLQISLHKSARTFYWKYRRTSYCHGLATKLYRKFNLDTLVHISMMVK